MANAHFSPADALTRVLQGSGLSARRDASGAISIEYLQVQEDHEPARRLYRQFGFEERYMYWYRGREETAAEG